MDRVCHHRGEYGVDGDVCHLNHIFHMLHEEEEIDQLRLDIKRHYFITLLFLVWTCLHIFLFACFHTPITRTALACFSLVYSVGSLHLMATLRQLVVHYPYYLPPYHRTTLLFILIVIVGMLGFNGLWILSPNFPGLLPLYGTFICMIVVRCAQIFRPWSSVLSNR